MTPQWFNFSMGFANDGCDGDTVRHILGVLHGHTINVSRPGGFTFNTTHAASIDVVVDTFDQDAESSDGSWPMYLVGWMYTEDTEDGRSSPIRIPLAGTSITII